MMTQVALVANQLRRIAQRDGCVTCGILIPSALTWAHGHPQEVEDRRRVFRLCWTCHRLYDHGILSTGEVLAAEDAWALGSYPDQSPFFERLATDLKNGIRLARKELQHKDGALKAGLKIRRRNIALKAVATRKLRASAKPNDAAQPLAQK